MIDLYLYSAISICLQGDLIMQYSPEIFTVQAVEYFYTTIEDIAARNSLSKISVKKFLISTEWISIASLWQPIVLTQQNGFFAFGFSIVALRLQ